MAHEPRAAQAIRPGPPDLCQRVVLRVTPYATFETPPRHVYQPEDVDTLSHYTSASMEW